MRRSACPLCSAVVHLQMCNCDDIPRMHLRFLTHSCYAGTTPTKPSGKAPGIIASVDDRLYAFEAVGLLLGLEEIDASEQLAYVSALLQPLIAQVATSLNTEFKSTQPHTASVSWLLHVLKAHLCATSGRPEPCC